MSEQKIAFLVAAEGTERVELTEPWNAVSEAGYEPVLLSPAGGNVQTFDHLTAAETRPVDKKVGDASVDDYAALVLPGGVANPDALRTDAKAVAFVKAFVDSGKPVAANAGAEWVDETVVTDENLITSRKPDDLSAFGKVLLGALG